MDLTSFYNIDESAILSDKVYSSYSADEYEEICFIIFDKYLSKNLRSFASSQVNNANYDEALKGMVHEKINKILFYPYEDLPLLINEEMSQVQIDLYRWRFKRGR
jgi:hypothetical protein